MDFFDFLKKVAFLASDTFCRLKYLLYKDYSVREVTESVRKCQKAKYFLSLSVTFLPSFLAETRMRVGKLVVTEMSESKMRVFREKITICKFFSSDCIRKGQFTMLTTYFINI